MDELILVTLLIPIDGISNIIAVGSLVALLELDPRKARGKSNQRRKSVRQYWRESLPLRAAKFVAYNDGQCFDV